MTAALIERNAAKAVAPASTIITNSYVHPVKKADMLAAVTTLRGKAIKHYEKYDVKGRKAMLQLLSEIYGAYRAAVNASQIAALVAELKEKLKAEDKTAPAMASDCSILIRYIFSNFSPKQIYLYSRTLEIASNKRTTPENFIAIVEEAGGMEKLCTANPVKGGESARATAVVTAINMAKNAPAAQSIPITNWAPEEKARIFVGVPDGHGMLKLVDANMTERSIEATLNRYRIDAEEAKKAKETVNAAAAARKAAEMVIQQANERQAKFHLKVLTAEQNLATANAAKSKEQIATATGRLMAAREALEEVEKEIEELTSQFQQQAIA